MPVNLERLLHDARRRAAELGPRRPDLERAAATIRPPAWQDAFAGPVVAVIAEVKRRSPSAGAIALELDPVRHATAYVSGGAAAISVLTDPDHFGGSVNDLRAVAASVGVPVLRKDFILDPLQIVEARAAGAAAVLLIVRALSAARLRTLLAEAAAWEIGTLVEVHSRQEASIALDVGAEVIGVNARDLDTFAIDPSLVDTILAEMPGTVRGIAESGIAGPQDVERVAASGADGILVGASVAGSPEPEAAVRALCGVPRRMTVRGRA